MIETRTVGAAIADHQRPAFGFVAERRGVAVAIFPAAAGAVIAVADEPVERPPELAVEGRVIIGELISYTKGKFIADHVFDENAVSKQMRFSAYSLRPSPKFGYSSRRLIEHIDDILRRPQPIGTSRP